MERLDNSEAEFWLILNKKGRKGAEFYQNCFPPLILSNSREVSNKYCIVIFPTHTDKNSAFELKPKFLQKGKISGGTEFFPFPSKFFSGFAKKLCKELAIHWIHQYKIIIDSLSLRRRKYAAVRFLQLGARWKQRWQILFYFILPKTYILSSFFLKKCWHCFF